MTNRSSHFFAKIAPLDEALRSGIQDIYARAQERTAALGGVCEASGRCCHFKKFGHQLWLTNLELALLVECHGARPPRSHGAFPYLTDDDKCSARDGRALGCRVFYCNIPSDPLQDVQNDGLSELRALAAEHGVELVYDEFLASLDQLTQG